MDQVETGCFAPARSGVEQPEAIRVVSWNINRGSRLSEIIDYLEAANGDLILLQETDRDARRTGYCNIAKQIAVKLRMNYAFGCEFHEVSQSGADSMAYHGQATLSPWPISDEHIIRFQSQSGFWRPRWYLPPISVLQRRIGGRMALVTRVSICQNDLIAYNLHLESRGNDDLRLKQFAQVLQDSCESGQDTPVLIGGDFNFDIRRPNIAAAVSAMRFENAFNGAHRITARSRFGRGLSIDFILTNPRFVSREPSVATSIKASDHFPLTVTLKLK